MTQPKKNNNALPSSKQRFGLFEYAAQQGLHGSIAHKGLTLEEALAQTDSEELKEAYRRFYNDEPIYLNEDDQD